MFYKDILLLENNFALTQTYNFYFVIC